MLDQQRTGAFITELRKEKGYTQKQLADEIGVSDKAVSRWETGRGLPDTSVMPQLCESLSISLNELLAGERLTGDAYTGKAEEIMVDLMKKTEDYELEKKRGRKGLLIGFVLLLAFFGFVLVTITAHPLNTIANFIDIPSLLFIVFVLYISLLAGGYVKDFHLAFKTIIGRGKIDADKFDEIVWSMEYALEFAIKAVLMGSFFVTLISLVVIFTRIKDPAVIGVNIAVALLTPIYALFFTLIIHMMKARIHRMR
jgi:transcriptional regulator with XRE-family HTH domain